MSDTAEASVQGPESLSSLLAKLAVPWRIEFEGNTYRESDLNLFMAQKALEMCGGDWTKLHPLASPDHLCALLATFLAAGGEDFDEAYVRVANLPFLEALELVKAD